MSQNPQTAISIIYDGACPFCSTYVRMIRLGDVVDGDIELISARDSDHHLVRELLDHDYDLDAGMAVIYQDEIYHGAEALNMLTLISTRSDFFNRLMKLLFSNRRTTRIAYPFLRAMRTIAVTLKGKPNISKSRPQ